MFINHNIDYDPDDSDFEVAIPINGRINISNKAIEVRIIPKTTVISVIYTGSYNELHQAYLRVHEYVHKHQYEIIGPTRELYLNNPSIIPEKELLTEFQIPIKINHKIM